MRSVANHAEFPLDQRGQRLAVLQPPDTRLLSHGEHFRHGGVEILKSGNHLADGGLGGPLLLPRLVVGENAHQIDVFPIRARVRHDSAIRSDEHQNFRAVDQRRGFGVLPHVVAVDHASVCGKAAGDGFDVVEDGFAGHGVDPVGADHDVPLDYFPRG